MSIFQDENSLGPLTVLALGIVLTLWLSLKEKYIHLVAYSKVETVRPWV